MDPIEAIRARLNEWHDQFAAECDTVRVDENDLRDLLAIAEAVIGWLDAGRCDTDQQIVKYNEIELACRRFREGK